MKLRHWFFLVFSFSFLEWGCSPFGEKVAGNGSEVENGIVGVVYHPNASPVAGAIITLVPNRYNPFTDTTVVLRQDTTDANGRFAFPVAPSDSYNLEANAPALKMKALISSLRPDTLILSEPGAITLEKSQLQATQIFIPGSTLKASVDTENFLWQSVPTGVFDLLYHGAQGSLADRLPVGSGHNTILPAQILIADSDTYLESSESAQNWGGKLYLRLKSGNQGVILVHFDLGSATVLDTATLWLAVSEFLPDFVPYSYQASIYGFTAPWVEGSGMYIGDAVNGSTYSESQPGIPWPGGFPGRSLDSNSRLDVSFQGIRGEQQRHPFPVSGKILRGLKSGAYTAIVLIENSSQYNNADFSSSEGSHPPELHLFHK